MQIFLPYDCGLRTENTSVYANSPTMLAAFFPPPIRGTSLTAKSRSWKSGLWARWNASNLVQRQFCRRHTLC